VDGAGSMMMRVCQGAVEVGRDAEVEVSGRPVMVARRSFYVAPRSSSFRSGSVSRMIRNSYLILSTFVASSAQPVESRNHVFGRINRRRSTFFHELFSETLAVTLGGQGPIWRSAELR